MANIERERERDKFICNSMSWIQIHTLHNIIQYIQYIRHTGTTYYAYCQLFSPHGINDLP